MHVNSLVHAAIEENIIDIELVDMLVMGDDCKITQDDIDRGRLTTRLNISHAITLIDEIVIFDIYLVLDWISNLFYLPTESIYLSISDHIRTY